ncbi:hypothetical protein GMAR_ORF282 [Golden Marseillevirus]|uniref:replication n=1 Tax=Golden Marseillevirus TaxID=1720526 RepID=UPI000877AE0E|nr:replication [Golden Marseillevirus]ALX27656.1 hypothetical protein GMAR_ORF282 [Golden Marseillevirus]
MVGTVQDTILSISSLKDNFCEPKTWDGKTSCPLCSFQGKDSGDLKRHYQSEEHKDRYLEKTKAPPSNSEFYEKRQGEDETEYTIRTSLVYSIGVIPSYLRVCQKYGTLWFSNALSKCNKNSLQSRRARGEKFLLSPQQYAHEYGKISGHDVFFAYEKTQTSRMFGSYTTFSDFWKNYIKVPDKEKRFNEQFLEGFAAREVFDLDSTAFSQAEAQSLNIPLLFQKLRQEFSEEKLNFFFVNASGVKKGQYKVSYHIVTSRVHYDIIRMGNFVQEFVVFLEKTKEGSILASLIDKGIYKRNRTLRCPWSVKFGENRRLLPIKEQTGVDPINFFATPEAYFYAQAEEVPEEEKDKPLAVCGQGEYEDALANFVETELGGCFEICNRGNGWFLQREKGEENHCPICDREHESDNYSAFVLHERLWLYCFRGEKSLALTKAPKGKKRQGMTEKSFEPTVPQLRADLCYENSTSRPVLFPEGFKCLAMRSAMGTGKTKALALYLQFQPNARVLSVTYRRTLARETSNKLGFVNYEDESSGWLRAKRLAVQIDSLHRVAGKYDLLVFDEITYTLSRLFCDVKEKDGCWHAFRHYVKTTPKILLLDKNLDQSSIDLFEGLGVPCYVVRNEYKAHTNKKLSVAASFLEFKKKLLQELSDGKKICFPSSSKKKMMLLCREAQDMGHRVLWYTGDGKSEEVWLSEWKNYDLVAYTPTISAGVSYEEKHFDKVYGYFSSRSCCAEEAEQMLFRVRNIVDSEVVLAFDGRFAKNPVQRNDVKEQVEWRDTISRVLAGIPWNPATAKILETPQSNGHIDALVKRNISKNDISKALLGLLSEQGMKPHFLIPLIERRELAELRKDAKFLEAKIKFEEAVEVCKAPEITKSEFSSLCSKRDKEDLEVLSCKKFMCSYNFCVPQSELTPEFVVEYSGKEKFCDNQRLAFTGNKQEQKERLEQLLERKNMMKDDTHMNNRIGQSINLEKVVYARRLFCWLGYGTTTSREKKTKEEMEERVKKIRERVKKSRHFQELFGKLPEDEAQTMRWINGVLRKIFDCYISKTSRNKTYYSWELIFCSPWKHGNEITATKEKYKGLVAVCF